MVAGAIGFTVLFAALFQRLVPTSRQIVFILVLAGGLAGLALSGAPEEARRTPPAYSWGMWAGVIVIAVVGAFVARTMNGDRAAAALGCLAGLAYGGTALCARALVADVSISDLRDPLLWGMLAYGALGLIFFTAALQRGSVTVATAWLFTAETVIPSIIGLTILGDSARSGYAGIAAVSFVVTIVAAVGLTLVSPPME
jgi:drug/metabolite transporter (DMT)-like permease